MAEKKVLVCMPSTAEFADVYHAVKESASRAEEQSGDTFVVFRAGKDFDFLQDLIRSLVGSDIIIADITDTNPNVLYEIGYAVGAGRPTIVITQRLEEIPADLGNRPIFQYDRAQLRRGLVPSLADLISSVASNPDAYTRDSNYPRGGSEKVPSAFVSYSHADSESLERLQVHLRPLVKKGKIDLWADTKIKAGDRWKEEIESALRDAAIAVLLISADFLASDFIVDNELPPILEGAEKKGTRILPIVLKPCRFARDEHLSKFQAINSPDRPLLLMDENEQERIWDELAKKIEIQLDNRRM